jgi:DNA-binding NtrC family response regulator
VQVLCKAIERDVGKAYPWPGNVRELEQAIRRVLVTGHYRGDTRSTPSSASDRFLAAMNMGELDAGAVLGGYCRLLYERHGTYEEVARLTNLDRRTVKKYIEQG